MTQEKQIIRLALILTIAFLTSITSCKNTKTENSFYYWKTKFTIDNEQNNMLKDLGVEKLYIRYFDIEYDNNIADCKPIAVINFPKEKKIEYSIIPVIYISNKSIKKTTKEKISHLANNTFKLIESINKSNKIKSKEIQIDCDWTVSTKEKYFLFLKEIKALCNTHSILLSTTIRLHQIKYPKITGVPPVEKGMLMYYNIGKLSDDPKRNSIYNQTDAALYSAYIKKYTLKLDLAIAAFSWAIHSRNGKIISLINEAQTDDYKENFIKLRPDLLEVNKSFLLRGKYFLKGDRLKFETITAQKALESAQYLKQNVYNQNRTITIFSLRSRKNKNYETENYKNIFNCFR